ncbi:hypothetical protein [Bosea sp. TND4EK4]|uniref:hypothetical protein n=1 Tax=Bosea sp. TND4EK4 TaxID=1907408 RepID=UPI0009567B5B|nr:hypothetical protein [Bosea sp. TND4EK4]SIR33630.1 hypothetical protein SAMN05880592_11656 [Bosea sp. TND4EK4]
MANTAFQVDQRAIEATPLRLPAGVLGAALAAFAAVSFWFCMLLGVIAPDWGLHKPWLQFYLGLTGFNPRSLALGTVQSLVFGSYTGVAIAFLFNTFNRWFG